MNTKVKAISTLYRVKRISIDGVKQAVSDGLITKKQYTEIAGLEYE